MYDFHYNGILPKYGKKACERSEPSERSEASRVKLLFTDTDSLCYEIEAEDFFQDISGDVENNFDTSNFPKDHPSGIPTGKNKNVPGLMKDEAGGGGNN